MKTHPDQGGISRRTLVRLSQILLMIHDRKGDNAGKEAETPSAGDARADKRETPGEAPASETTPERKPPEQED